MEKYTVIGVDSKQRLCVRWVECSLRELCEVHLDLTQYKKGPTLVFAGHIDPPTMVVPVAVAVVPAQQELVTMGG